MAAIEKKTILELDEATFDEVKDNGFLVVSQEEESADSDETERKTYKVPVDDIQSKINDVQKKTFKIVNLNSAEWADVVSLRSNGFNMVGINANYALFDIVVNETSKIVFENLRMSVDSDGNNVIVKTRYEFSSSAAKNYTEETIAIPSGGSGGDFDPNGSYDSTTGNTLSCNKVNGVVISFASGISQFNIV